MDYFAVRDSLKTGDILLFRAGTSTAGKAAGIISGSPFSHVAMVVRYTPNGGQETLCMWESGRDDIKDVVMHERLRGVHLVELDSILESYTAVWEGDFVVRRLGPPLGQDRRDEIEQWLEPMSGKPFPDLWELALDQIVARFNPTRFNRRTYACAELIAETLQRVSLLPLDRPTESYSARDFSAGGGLRFQFDFALGPEELVTYPVPRGEVGARMRQADETAKSQLGGIVGLQPGGGHAQRRRTVGEDSILLPRP